MKENFTGQKVIVRKVETPFDKNATVIGICTFFGTNEFLNKKQVTVGRMPIFINDFNQVQLAK